jgi:hypothetical protein
MKQRFSRYKRKYGQRWQVETVNSMLKRRLGSALRARQYKTQCQETILRAITHNVMIIRIRVFYRAGRDSFREPVLALASVPVSHCTNRRIEPHRLSRPPNRRIESRPLSRPRVASPFPTRPLSRPEDSPTDSAQEDRPALHPGSRPRRGSQPG